MKIASKWVRSFLCTAVLCFSPISAAQSEESQVKKAPDKGEIFPVRLNATVTISESFPPLPDSLKPGQEFSRARVLGMLDKSENRWYVVPKWMAGMLSYGSMESYYAKDFSDGKETNPKKSQPGVTTGRHRGMVVDKKGNIWQLSQGGLIGDPAHPDAKDYYRFDDEIFGYLTSPKEYSESSEGIEFFLMPDSKISAVMRYQRVRDFSLTPDGKVRVYVTELTFDLEGKPVYILKSRGFMTKQEEFKPRNPEIQIVGGGKTDAISALRAYLVAVDKAADAPDNPADSLVKAKAKPKP